MSNEGSSTMADEADLTELMHGAIEVAKKGVSAEQSPFGAVIARTNGEVIVAAHNRVRVNCDATAHAEIEAIRGACGKLGTIDLSGYVIAATCEPCPMCAAAIHWARLDEVIYGASIPDARRAGFREIAVSIDSLAGWSPSVEHRVTSSPQSAMSSRSIRSSQSLSIWSSQISVAPGLIAAFSSSQSPLQTK